MKKPDPTIQIGNVVFTAANPDDAQAGLIGWLSAIINGSLRIDGIALRRCRSGRLTLSFPARQDGCGKLRYYLRPIDDPSRREIERQIFSAIGIREDVA